jgi:hypothetical protein
VIEPKAPDDQGSAGRSRSEVEAIAALGKRIYRFCRPSPELLAFDPATLWRVIYASYDEDGEGRQVLAHFEDTSAWVMAVLTAKLMHEVYAAGGLEEEPA